MRDLDKINPKIVRPSSFAAWVFFIVSITLQFYVVVPEMAAPEDLPLTENYLALAPLFLSGIFFLAIPIPKIFNWGWKAKWMALETLLFGLVAGFLGLYVQLTIAIYGKLPLWVSLGLLFTVIFYYAWWCSRVVKQYLGIYANVEERAKWYVEEKDVVYYIQSFERRLLEKEILVKDSPSSLTFIIFVIVALATMPFHHVISSVVGIDYQPILVAIGWIPIGAWFLAVVTKLWLIYGYFPIKIKRATGKEVYVDLASKS